MPTASHPANLPAVSRFSSATAPRPGPSAADTCLSEGAHPPRPCTHAPALSSDPDWLLQDPSPSRLTPSGRRGDLGLPSRPPPPAFQAPKEESRWPRPSLRLLPSPHT